MKYTGSVTLIFRFDVPGDDPADEDKLRNRQTAPAAATVINEAAKDIWEAANPYLSRFTDPELTFSGEPVVGKETG
jgi:hypothetical protein